MTDKAKKYLSNMDSAIGDKLINPSSIYYGPEGHARFARECGYALNDFSEQDRTEIVSTSYGRLYVKHCNLKPIFDAKEWITILMREIVKKYPDYNMVGG